MTIRPLRLIVGFMLFLSGVISSGQTTDSPAQENSYSRKQEEKEQRFRVYGAVKDENGEVVMVEKVKVVNSIDNFGDEDYRHDKGYSAIPDFVGGVNLVVNAYGFDLNVQTAFQLGGWIYDTNYASLMAGGKNGQTFHKDLYNRWVKPGQITNAPQLCYEGSSSIYTAGSDRWLTSASYFSLKNVTFGYTLPKNISKKAHIERARLYFAGDNLWLKSARKGLDPRQYLSGEVGYGYTPMSTFSIGVNLTL